MLAVVLQWGQTNEIIKSRRARFNNADALMHDLSKKPASSKRANLPRASDYTKGILKD